MSHTQSTYGQWYLSASYGQSAEILGETYPDRMAWIESRAAEVLAEIATSTAARLGNRDLIAEPVYHGKTVLPSQKDRTAAPAPATKVHSGKRPSVHPYNVPRDWVSPKDLQSRCMAAARMTLTGRQTSGKKWSAEDVAECASEILLATLERQTETVRHGRPADVLRFIDRNLHRTTGHVAPEAATMARLVHLAANWRRGMDRQRRRDAEDAAGRASIAGKTFARVTDEATAGPMAAAKRAIDALQNLGLDPKSARRVWPLAYATARGTEDIPAETVAAELGMTVQAFYKACQRAAAAVPSAAAWSNPYTGTDHAHVWNYTDHLEAVCAECEAFPADPRALATDAADAPDWPARSAARYANAPLTVRVDASVKRDQRRNYSPAAWTAGLAPNTRRRLETASAMKRARAAARTASETETRQLAAGIAG